MGSALGRVAPSLFPPYLFGHPVPGQEPPGFLPADGFPLCIPQLIRPALPEHCQDPCRQVAHHRPHGLLMVLAVVDHLPIVDRRKLGVVAAAYLPRLIEGPPDDWRSCFGHPQSLGFHIG